MVLVPCVLEKLQQLNVLSLLCPPSAAHTALLLLLLLHLLPSPHFPLLVLLLLRLLLLHLLPHSLNTPLWRLYSNCLDPQV